MIEQFIHSLSLVQLVVVIYLAVYLLIYGVRYHMLAAYAHLSGRSVDNDWMGITLNYLGYAAILACLYWFV